jgi:PKD repeat protein/subtilisin-like proprotein convertase family protein
MHYSLFRIILFYFCTLFFYPVSLQAQSFVGTGGPIPDDENSVTFNLTVQGLPSVTDTQSFGLESVCLNINHTWNDQLFLRLVAPNGEEIYLFSGLGGYEDNFVNTCLNSNAAVSIKEADYPFTGTYRPIGELGVVNLGLNPNGVWQLYILDQYPFGSEGVLVDWTLTFGPNPSLPFQFESSNLPILEILTEGGEEIVDEPKIDAHLKVRSNNLGLLNMPTDPADEEHFIGIELRGNLSQSFPKKSYRFEVRDSLTDDDVDIPLLGLPETSDYLLMAEYADKTLMRNALTYELSRQMGQYATRGRFCELIVNGRYRGVYLLLERIKRGSERLDIPKLEAKDTVGNALTGGYILLIDRGTSQGWYSQYELPNTPGFYHYIEIYYPRFDEIQPVQYDYIRAYMDGFESALAGPEFQNPDSGWRQYGEEQSFIDFLILNELSRNIDGYRLSTFLHKQRDDRGGKLRMGPVWDFDLGWFNAGYCASSDTSGWAYNFNFVCTDNNVPFWWQRFEEDTLFQQNLACRWQSLRQTTLGQSHIFALIDSMAAVVDQGQVRNFDYWGNLGTDPDTYVGELDRLKGWITSRLNWMDDTLSTKIPNLNANFEAQTQNGLQFQFSPQSTSGVFYQWDFGDSQRSNQPNPSHTFASVGTYTVQLTVSTLLGCSATSTQIITIVSSTNALPDAEVMRILPNPTTGRVQLLFPPQVSEEKQIRVLDALGRTVINAKCTEQIQTFWLDLSALPNGTYEVQLVSGRYAGAKTILKQ